MQLKRAPWGIPLVLAVSSIMPVPARSELVRDLNDRARIAVTPHAQAIAIVEMAYVHIAIYDAVNAIDGRHTVFAVKPSSAPPGASKEAAAISAAYTVLIWRVPGSAVSLAADRDALLATIPDGQAKTDGIAIGTEVGNGVIALRTGDGLEAPNPPYTFGSGPGVYQQIPIFQPRVDPVAGSFAVMKPFTLASNSQFRAQGPSRLGSKEWADDYNEVKARGAKVGSVRTPEETNLGISYTENTLIYYTRIYHNLAVRYDLGLEDAARYFAMLYVVQSDCIVAVFDSKYHFNFWRPWTAIHAGDTDGNPDTDPDST